MAEITPDEPKDVAEELPTPVTASGEGEEDTQSDARTAEPSPPTASNGKHRLKRFLATKKGKAVAILVGLVFIVVVLLAIPATRYGILGMFIKKDVTFIVEDSATKKVVSAANVTIGAMNAKTDSAGKVTLKELPVGEYTAKISKKYYRDASFVYEVPVLGSPKEGAVTLEATGRQVTLSVANSITKEVVAGASITINDVSSLTNDKGIATLVLPADKKLLKASVKAEGYNDTEVEVKVTDQTDANNFSVVPSGTIYFLSKQTGKINVMKSNLDGSASTVVVEGTGNENDRETVLLAARDWNYMALSSKRDANKAGQLYLVDGKSGKLTTIDEGDASFQLVGWSDHRFIYLVNRNNKGDWETQTQVLKSYNAETGKLTILDETVGMGTNYNDYQREYMQSPYILAGKIVYSKRWSQGGVAPVPSDKKSAIMTVNPDGSGKQRVKEFGMQRYIDVSGKLYEPQDVYFRVSADNDPATYYEYENNTAKSVSGTDDKFNNTFYPTYLVSPGNQKTFWYEPRDGKNTLLVGDKDGKDGLTLASQSEYKAYGWYSDKYVLLSKNDSELYITSSSKPIVQPIKITNYHRPDVSYPGYGYGYGGNG